MTNRQALALSAMTLAIVPLMVRADFTQMKKNVMASLLSNAYKRSMIAGFLIKPREWWE
jgi:hypothetical protein